MGSINGSENNKVIGFNLMVDVSVEGRTNILKKCAQTSLNSKCISSYKELIANMRVKAAAHFENYLNEFSDWFKTGKWCLNH